MNITEKNQILVFNGPEDKSRTISSLLNRDRFEVRSADLGDCVETVRATGAVVAVLMNLQPEQARELVAKLRFSSPWTQVVVTLTTNDPLDLISLVKNGAYDCLSADTPDTDLSVRVLKAAEYASLQTELVSLRQHVAMNYGFDNIVGTSKAITKVKDAVARVAPTDIAVMLLGETGTGKELLARVIHHHSNRRRNGFILFDCSVAGEERLTLELFGNGEQTPGALRDADKGTLFLDSIEKMPGSIQARLAAFLKTNTLIDPTTGQTTRLDIRFITSGAANLPQTLKEIGFSEELFYKLSVLPIKVPSLAERVEDIELLTDYFLRKLAHETGTGEYGITRAAIDSLDKHDWPGNVRELENTLRRAATLCTERVIDCDDIAFIQSDSKSSEIEGPHRAIFRKKTGSLDDNQRNVIARALKNNDWNFTQTAIELGIGRTTLWRKVKKYELKKETVSS